MDTHDEGGFSRRQALAALGGAALGAVPGCAEKPSPARPQEPAMTSASNRMPTVYLPHGGGPWPFVDLGMGEPESLKRLATYLRSLQALPPKKPEAVLMISAHWEEAVPTVMTGERPPLLFDYYGFPPEAYKLTWPAPGQPRVAERVRQLLGAAGIPSGVSADRGFDHGTFVPMKLTYPEADVPTLQLSLKKGLDPAEHLAIGRALAPLRDEGVFIVGSGMSYHNMRGFFRGGREASSASEAFDGWLNESIALSPAERDRRLSGWAGAPSARLCHPREEHLLPLMVIAGAAGADVGRTGYKSTLMGVQVSAHHFG